MVILPTLMMPVAVGLIFIPIVDPDFGVLNTFLGIFGLPNHTVWTGTSSLAMLTIIMLDSWQWTPFVFLALFSGLEMIPQECLESAEIDGASRSQMLLFIKVPLLLPTILPVLLLRGVDSFKVYDIIYSLTKGGPGRGTELLTTYIYKLGFTELNFGKAAGASIIMMILATLLSQTVINRLYSRTQF